MRYFDGGHDNKEVAFLNAKLIKLVGVGGGLALKDDFLRVDFESFLVLNFGLEV